MWVRGTAGRMHKGWMTKVLSTPGLWAALPSLMGIDLCRTTQDFPSQGASLGLASSLWAWGKTSKVIQLCPTLCDPMDCSLPGFSVHGILQARILEGVTISFSRGSSWPRDRTRVSRIGGSRFNLWGTREALGNPFPKLFWICTSSQRGLVKKSSFSGPVLPGYLQRTFLPTVTHWQSENNLFEEQSKLIPSHIYIHAGPRWYQSNVINCLPSQRRTVPTVHSLFREMAPKNLIFTGLFSNCSEFPQVYHR